MLKEKRGLTDRELADLQSIHDWVLIVNEDCGGKFFHRGYMTSTGNFFHARKYRESEGWVISKE